MKILQIFLFVFIFFHQFVYGDESCDILWEEINMFSDIRDLNKPYYSDFYTYGLTFISESNITSVPEFDTDYTSKKPYYDRSAFDHIIKKEELFPMLYQKIFRIITKDFC